jgi:DNA topoisomerase-1
MRLVIVESPAKCSKIQEYLGSGYRVLASMGHIRALKQDLDAVGIERSWVPDYEIIKTKAKTVKQLRDAASDADEVIIATDDDREGEGIAFHICSVLKLDPTQTKRIVFHSITKPAIQTAVQEAKTVDMDKFHAQQTRAMLDMLIGYTLSPVLWKQLNSNGLPLSAGRCQTPALKLVLDRDLEIEKHMAKGFWKLNGQFLTAGLKIAVQAAREHLQSDQEVTAYLQPATQTQKAHLHSLKNSVRTHNAPKPLITSTLQQEGSKSFGLSPKMTMSTAQKLYEAGHITYMRTDNAFLSQEGAAGARKVISKDYGEDYLGPAGQHQVQQTPAAKKKGSVTLGPQAQAAHEAIRPTHPEVAEPEGLSPVEAKVYRLIWQRALQSQMATSTEDCRGLTFTLEADPTKAPWYGEQLKSKFLGWKILSTGEKAQANAAESAEAYDAWAKVAVNAAATWSQIAAEEEYTRPPNRYTEASLIHELEHRGIGRPSTFASLVETLVERAYVDRADVAGTTLSVRKWQIQKPQQWPPKETQQKQVVGKETNRLQTTALGRTVAEFLYKHYSDIFDYRYTALMESELDRIARGERSWKTLLQSNWDAYKARYTEHLAKVQDPEAKKAHRTRDLGDGIQVILSRKGPLLLKEATKEFASLPRNASFDTVTLIQAQAAYKAKDGEDLGQYGDDAILKKKGPYGFYAQCGTIKVPVKPEDTFETIVAKIQAKDTPQTGTDAAYERIVGEYKIKNGPYGLYFFKHAAKKATFFKFTGPDPDKATAEELDAMATKRRGKKVGLL